MKESIQEAELLVKDFLSKDGSGHDWYHIERVRNMALTIAKGEDCNTQLVELIALLHDMGDYKLHNGSHEQGEKFLDQTMVRLGLESELAELVKTAIGEISFKGAKTDSGTTSIEASVVQDADRLDAIGAIGIARAFAYGGSKHRLMHSPELKPTMHDSFEAYSKAEGTTVNHFYEKLLLLKDLMNTQTGKHIAAERHEYMSHFLKKFYEEWEGKS